MLTMWRISLALLICLVAVPAYSNPPLPTPSKPSNPPQESSPKREQEAEKYVRGTKEFPLSVELINTEKSKEETEREAKREEDKSFHEYWLNILTGILATSTAALAIITGFLVSYTKKLWGATKSLMEGAKDTAERQLRAYMGIESASATFSVSSLIVHVAIKNSGQTPAYKIRVWNKLCVFDPANAPVFLKGDSTDNYSMLGAGVPLVLTADLRDLQKPDMVSIGDGTRPTYIWGEIAYRDVFKIERNTTFRLSIRRKPGGEWYLRPTDDGNEAD